MVPVPPQSVRPLVPHFIGAPGDSGFRTHGYQVRGGDGRGLTVHQVQGRRYLPRTVLY